MQQVNVHQQKLYALIEAGFALVGLFLTWYTTGLEGFAQQISRNGFEDWGWLSAAGVGGVVVCSFLMPDKTKPYDANTKKIALASFAAITLGAIITLIRLQASNGQIQIQGYTVTAKTTAGAGIWMTLVAGVVGLAWVSGILAKLSTPAAAAPTPPPPTPPTPPIVS